MQPEIASFRGSAVGSERRERAESCYVKVKNRGSMKNLALISQESFESAVDEVSREFVDNNREEYGRRPGKGRGTCERIEMFGENAESFIEVLGVGCGEMEFRGGGKEESARNSEPEISGEPCRSDDNNRSSNGFTDRSGVSGVQEIHQEPVISLNCSSVSFQCRSIESIPDINGKVFTYFDKALLCQIPVLSFSQVLERFKSLQLSEKHSPVISSSIFAKKFLCCIGENDMQEHDKVHLDQLMKFSKSKFDYSDEFHLELLLAAYCSITGEADWPSNDKEWLDMGFSSEDLAAELEGDGALGLFYMFFLASFFPKFLKEMLDVSRYFSYEVFKVCKFFAVDTVEIVRKGTLNRLFSNEGGTLEAVFLFYTGMVMEWFNKMIKNKDFNETYQDVVNKAKKFPLKLITVAKKEMVQ